MLEGCTIFKQGIAALLVFSGVAWGQEATTHLRDLTSPNAGPLPGGAASEGQVANESAYDGQQPGVELTIQPSLCILERGETLCRDQVQVRWQSADIYNVCLFEAGINEPLSCWEESRSGQFDSLLEAQDDIHFQLIEMVDRRVIASQAFEVVADAQRYRRRRRNPWSFF